MVPGTDNREFKIYDATAATTNTNFAYLMNKNKTFARLSRAFIITIHLFPVLGKSAMWNDHRLELEFSFLA